MKVSVFVGPSFNHAIQGHPVVLLQPWIRRLLVVRVAGDMKWVPIFFYLWTRNLPGQIDGYGWVKRLSIKTCDSRSVLHLQVDVCDKQSFMSWSWWLHPFKSKTCCIFVLQGRMRAFKAHHLVTREENGGNTVNHTIYLIFLTTIVLLTFWSLHLDGSYIFSLERRQLPRFSELKPLSSYKGSIRHQARYMTQKSEMLYKPKGPLAWQPNYLRKKATRGPSQAAMCQYSFEDGLVAVGGGGLWECVGPVCAPDQESRLVGASGLRG